MSDVADAFQAAKAELQRLSLGLRPGAGLDSVRFNLMCMTGLHIDPDDPATTLQFTGDGDLDHVLGLAAAGDGVADDALREVAADCRKRNQPLPGALVDYLLRPAPKRRRARHPNINIWRDYAICRAVQKAAACGPPAIGGASARLAGETGCAVVTRALAEIGIHLSEGAVVKIWQDRNRGYFDRPLGDEDASGN